MDDQHETQFQDLEWARPRIKAQIKNNKHRGMGASVSVYLLCFAVNGIYLL